MQQLRTTKQGVAAEFIRELLTDGPMRPRNLKAEAKLRGLSFDEQTWERAKRQAGVEAFGTGRSWFWRLPSDCFEEQCAAWLDTPHGKFAQYLAARDRLGPAAKLRLSMRIENSQPPEQLDLFGGERFA